MPYDPTVSPPKRFVHNETVDALALNSALDRVQGFPTEAVGELTTDLALTGDIWYATGITLPTETDADWLMHRLNAGEWHFSRTYDYHSVEFGTAGVTIADDEIWAEFFELFGRYAHTIGFGITSDRELLIGIVNAGSTTDRTIHYLGVRSSHEFGVVQE